MNYEDLIQKIITERIITIEEVKEASNKVFKVKTDKETLYAKFYVSKSAHIDNEIIVYDLVDTRYLKEIYYISEDGRFAVFKEVRGKTVDELTEEEMFNNCDRIVIAVCEFFEDVSKNKTQGYGILDENLCGKYDNFTQFLKSRQKETSKILKDYPELSTVANKIFEKYENIMIADNSLIPIDTNMKNIMVLDDKSIKFIDPGQMISGPILMAYGDFVAHSYNTPLYVKLIEKLNVDRDEEILLRIYAIFSSLNTLAFLQNVGVENIKDVHSFGNPYTFYENISEHLKFLQIDK